MRCDVIIHTAALPHLEVGEKRIHTTTDIVCVLELGRRHVTQEWAANALAGDVVQPEDSVQPERKTLRAEDITSYVHSSKSEFPDAPANATCPSTGRLWTRLVFRERCG